MYTMIEVNIHVCVCAYHLKGCDICLEDNFGRTGVHLAALKDHPAVIQCLLDRGMELDTADQVGKNPAHYSAQHGNLASLKVLVKNAVDISVGMFIHEGRLGHVIYLYICIIVSSNDLRTYTARNYIMYGKC